jgi:hypothetical protein
VDDLWICSSLWFITKSVKPGNALGIVGVLGAIFAAAASPCCLPALAIAGSALGLGFLAPYETAINYAIQVLVALAVVGTLLTYRRHRRIMPLLVSTLSAAVIFFTYHIHFAASLVYLGLIGLAIGAVWDLIARSNVLRGPRLKSVITCPKCGHRTEETMPTNACLFFYDCPACGAKLKPKTGDCCVFCSYGSMPCPPIQMGTACRA